MKNDKIIKLLLLTFIFTVFSICIVSGTYAKYASSIVGTDTARVAKFSYTINGINETNNTINLFDTSEDTGLLSTETKVVAPGTEGTFSLQLTNNSEVLIKSKYTFEETSNTGDIPIIYTYSDKNYSSVLSEGSKVKKHATDTTNITIDGDLDDLSNAIETASNSIQKGATSTINLGWCWAFEGVDGEQTNATDTILGKKTTLDEITVKVTCDVIQIDESE